MLAESVGIALDVDGDGAMEETIEDGGRHRSVPRFKYLHF